MLQDVEHLRGVEQFLGVKAPVMSLGVEQALSTLMRSATVGSYGVGGFMLPPAHYLRCPWAFVQFYTLTS